MSNDLIKSHFSADEIRELQEQLYAHKKASSDLTWAQLGKEIDVNHSTLSLWATGKYPGDNGSIALKVDRWFRAEEVQLTFLEERPMVPGYLETKTARRIRNLLGFARTGKLNIIIGDPGVGKTRAIEHFALHTPNTWKITGHPTAKSVNGMLKLLSSKILGSIPRGGGAQHLSSVVRDRVAGVNALIIVDESQHLDELAIEELRSIHDETKVGLVFAGNRTVLSRIEGNREAAFAQRFSRVSLRMLIDKPEPEDVSLLLDAWNVGDREQRAFLSKIAMKPGGGALRSMSNCLELATMLAQDVADTPRNLEHIEDAWSQLSHRPGMAAA